AAFDATGLAQSLAERGYAVQVAGVRCAAEKSNDRHRRLLRVRRDRPHRRAAERRYELAALHVDFVLPFASPATACHPASLILIRVTSIILPPATLRSARAAPSPARTRSGSS